MTRPLAIAMICTTLFSCQKEKKSYHTPLGYITQERAVSHFDSTVIRTLEATYNKNIIDTTRGDIEVKNLEFYKTQHKLRFTHLFDGFVNIKSVGEHPIPIDVVCVYNGADHLYASFFAETKTDTATRTIRLFLSPNDNKIKQLQISNVIELSNKKLEVTMHTFEEQ